LTAVHVEESFLGRCCVGVFQCCFASVLTGFPKQGEVELDNLSIKFKYRLKVFLNDVSRQVGDDHNF